MLYTYRYLLSLPSLSVSDGLEEIENYTILVIEKYPQSLTKEFSSLGFEEWSAFNTLFRTKLILKKWTKISVIKESIKNTREDSLSFEPKFFVWTKINCFGPPFNEATLSQYKMDYDKIDYFSSWDLKEIEDYSEMAFIVKFFITLIYKIRSPITFYHNFSFLPVYIKGLYNDDVFT